MPKATIKELEPIEVISILDADGNADTKLAPDLPADELRKMFRAMLLARRFDERLLNLQRQGKVGTFAPVKGQEASQIGSIAAIGDDDWFVPAFRESAASIWRGTPLEAILLFTAGYNEGQRIPDGKHDLPISIPVASQIPHAVGIAYAAKLRGENAVAMTFFGDGATSEGDFHEALNFAGVFDVPAVFVCQNNHWAISIPRNKQTRSQTLAQKAAAYGIKGIQVDGNDILAVYHAAAEAVERAREENLPTLIECVTYRMEVHTTADDPTRYRNEQDVEKWAARDPIARFKTYLKAGEMLDDDALDEMEEEIKTEIDDAWKNAQETIVGFDRPDVIFDHIFAEMPAGLVRQRDSFNASREAPQEDEDG